MHTHHARMRNIEIFRAGRHTDINGVQRQFSDADLQGMAGSYDPKLHEAPIVVGHPRTDDPAYGWVQSLKVAAGKLVAIPHQVNAAFSELVQAGSYKKVSAAFYAPSDKNNPAPGKWYLRHVGFLGAQPPAIKGLAGASFGEGDALDSAVVIEFSESEGETPTATTADTQKPDSQDTTKPPAESTEPSPSLSPATSPDSPNEPETSPDEKEPTVTEAEAAALKAQNTELQKQLEAAHQREAAAAAAARTAEHTAFAEKLVSEGRLPEADKARIVAMADAIHPAGADPVMFGEGDAQTTLYQQFQQFLQALPKRVEFGEIATRDAAGESPSYQYAEGTDPDRIALDKRIRAYAAQHKVSYGSAFAAVTKQD